MKRGEHTVACRKALERFRDVKRITFAFPEGDYVIRQRPRRGHAAGHFEYPIDFTKKGDSIMRRIGRAHDYIAAMEAMELHRQGVKP